MKKLFSILCLFLLVGYSNAQVVTAMTKSAVTMTNSTAVTATLNTNYVTENLSIQAVVTKSTGTVAGTVQVSASLDGTNYVNLTASTSTLALTDQATNTGIFNYTKNNYLFYKLTFTGTGTMVATPSASVFSSGLSNKHVVSNMTSNVSLTSDTTTDTGVSYVGLGVTNWYNTVTIQSVVTKISGTVAGTVTLQGSIDGTNYVTVNSSYADVTSYSPTNVATSSKLFVVTGSPYRYYRLSYTGAGTMAASHRGYVLPNKN
jgi:hypothetical protein